MPIEPAVLKSNRSRIFDFPARSPKSTRPPPFHGGRRRGFIKSIGVVLGGNDFVARWVEQFLHPLIHPVSLVKAA